MNKSKARREKRHQQKTERDIRRAHAQALREIRRPVLVGPQFERINPTLPFLHPSDSGTR